MKITPDDEPLLEPKKNEEEIGIRLKTLTTLIHRRLDRACRDNGGDDGVTGMGVWILGYLLDTEDEGRDVFQRDLEERIHIRRATVSKMIILMEQKGYISRSAVKSDARLKKLIVTPKGKELFEARINEVNSVEKMICDGIPPDKLETFVEVCERMKKNLLEEEDGFK